MIEPIPVLLVSALPYREDGRGVFDIRTKLTPQNVIALKGKVETEAEIALIDTMDTIRHEVIIAALLLRNAGRTVVVGDLELIPYDLIKSLNSFIIEKKSSSSLIRSEVILMEDAMKLYGDISDIGRFF